MKHFFLHAMVLCVAGAVAVACDDSLNDCKQTLEPCGDGGTAAQGPGGSTTTQGGGGTTSTGGGGQGGTGGTETCTDNPSLCQGPTPVCVNGSCEQCAPGDDALCMGETPWCNPATLACEACSYHAHCPDSACNVFTGECLDATPKEVGPGKEFLTLTLALASVADGTDAVFLVSPTAGDYNEAVTPTIAGTRTVALLGVNGRPSVRATSGGPTFDVYNGATLLLEGIDLRGNTASRGIQADGLVALDRVEIAQNSSGGINATGTAELLIRNSIIAGNGTSATAIQLGEGKLDLFFSSVGSVIGTSAAVSCGPGHTLTVRSSILFNRNANPTVASCTSASITHTSADETLTGTGNDNFGDPEQMPSLFVNLDNGNLRLTADGKAAFDGVALWQPGDPPTDIDGGGRPTSEAPDVAGAHLGP
jgi:hypothetical protein